MIACPVCGQQNDDLAVVCSSCHGYLQSKVDNLNLFETIWQLMERPRVAFKRIVLATHKNYVYLLSSLLGMSLTFGYFWLRKIGSEFSNVITLVGAGGLIGVGVGILFVVLVSVVLVRCVRLMGGKASIRNTMAVIAYAGVPIVISLAFVFPLEIAIFGKDFFGSNPPPIVINAPVYVALLGFDSIAVLWTLVLLYHGLSVLTGFRTVKSIVVTIVTALIPGALSVGLRYI